ncbi:hypothetical protein ACIBKX_00160 [Streptomyces sp. NPDC050658]
MKDRQHKPRKRWTGAERWQVSIGLLGLLVAITGCVGQFVQ